MSEKDKSLKYISLAEAAKYLGCYSQEYLSLRARQGKLKAVKFGRNWKTTKEWLREYLIHTEEFKNNRNKNNKLSQASDVKEQKETIQKPEKVQAPEIQLTKPIFTQPVSPRAIAVVVALIFILASVGTLFSYPYFTPVLKEIATDLGTDFTEVSASLRKSASEIREGIVKKGDDVSRTISDSASDFAIGTVNNFARYVSQDIKAVKKGFQELSQKIERVFQKITKVFKEKPEIPEGILSQVEELQQEIQELKEQLKELRQGIQERKELGGH